MLKEHNDAVCDGRFHHVVEYPYTGGTFGSSVSGVRLLQVSKTTRGEKCGSCEGLS